MDGEIVAFEPSPYIENGIVLAPVRTILDRWGMDISWDAESGSITAVKRDNRLRLTLGSPYANVNGRVALLPKSPFLRDGSMYAPLESVAASLGAETIWSGKLSTLYVKTGAGFTIDRLLDEVEQMTYEGDTLYGMKHGQGRLFSNGQLWYEGEFVDNRMNGYGKLYISGRLYYEGTFADNHPEGSGIFYYANGHVYEGGIKDSLPDGKGQLTSGGKPLYDGEWKAGYRNGLGKLMDESGQPYFEGYFVQNQRNGYGVLKERGGSARIIYEGEWKNDVMEGNGRSYAADGKIEYEGQWKDNKKNGKGIVYTHYESNWIQTDDTRVISRQAVKNVLMTEKSFANGFATSQGEEKVYVGDVDQLGLPEGSGRLYAAKKRMATQAGVLNNLSLIYDGQFSAGKMEGRGKLYDGNQQLIYDGELQNNMRHGEGLSLKNGRIEYDGEWRSDRESGMGRVYTYGDDFTGADFVGNTSMLIHEGIFRNGSMVQQGNIYKYYGAVRSGMPEGRGTIVMLYDSTDKEKPALPLDDRAKGELIYEGAFKNGLRDGEGKLYEDNVLVYEGPFLRGLRQGIGKAYEDNTVYEGPFINDRKEGQGKIYDAYRTLIFEGDFRDDKKNGYGKQYDRYGKLEYEGEYKNGKRHGYGRLYSGGYSYYQGEFVEDKRLEEYLRDKEREESE
jgi:antitoxin component YwqK of YwqJK toxin-antitoxin module